MKSIWHTHRHIQDSVGIFFYCVELHLYVCAIYTLCLFTNYMNLVKRNKYTMRNCASVMILHYDSPKREICLNKTKKRFAVAAVKNDFLLEFNTDKFNTLTFLSWTINWLFCFLYSIHSDEKKNPDKNIQTNEQTRWSFNWC